MNVPDLEWNQRPCGKDHQEFSPTFLQINTDAFREEHRRIKKRQQTGSAQLSIGQDGLQFVQQIEHGLAVNEKKLISGPIRNGVEPMRPAIQEQEGEPQSEGEQALYDFEKGDELEVADALWPAQNRWLRFGIAHSLTLRRTGLTPQRW